MLRRIALIAVIAGAYGGAMYTSIGCSPLPESSPTEPPTIFGTMRGAVTNASTGAAIPGAEIFVSGTRGISASVFTDNTGRYGVSMPVGNVSVRVSRSGYQTANATADIAATGVTTLDFKLQPLT